MAPLILLSPALALCKVCSLPGLAGGAGGCWYPLAQGHVLYQLPTLASWQLGAVSTCAHTWLQSPLCVPPPQLFLQHVVLQHVAISHVWPKLSGFAACKTRKT